jgi:4-hydroxy-3-methylbut-2-enyl diphosphate reductase
MKAQRIAKSYMEKGYQVIIFGDKKHKEVKSIQEWSGNIAKIISSLKEVKKIKLNKYEKYCLISQTTQNVEEFKKINSYLRNILPHFTYFNTICDSTDSRQNETRNLAKKNDVVLVIGGKDSANSKRLFEIAKSININSYFIENIRQLKNDWFENIRSLAITAGASTPEWAIENIIDKIEKIS